MPCVIPHEHLLGFLKAFYEERVKENATIILMQWHNMRIHLHESFHILNV